jgi:hypothetical protein
MTKNNTNEQKTKSAEGTDDGNRGHTRHDNQQEAEQGWIDNQRSLKRVGQAEGRKPNKSK